MKRHSVFIGAAAAAILVIGASVADAQKVLKLGTVGRAGLPLGDAIKDTLVPKTAEISGGKLTIKAHYRRSICAEQKCGEQANQGLLAIWTSSTANFGNFGTAMSIFDLPFMFKNLDLADKISDSWLGNIICEEVAKTTEHRCFEVFSTGGFRHLSNTRRSVHVPADLKGIKMRVTKSPIEFTLIKTWGAVPVPYDWVQLYQGLQTGVVEGLYAPPPWQFAFKMHEVQDYYTAVGGMWSGDHISIDNKQYNALSADEKKWLRAGMDEFSRRARSLDQAWIRDLTAELIKKVADFYEPNDAEMELWRAGAIGTWKESKGTYDPKLAERALMEQGLNTFIEALKAAGAL